MKLGQSFFLFSLALIHGGEKAAAFVSAVPGHKGISSTKNQQRLLNNQKTFPGSGTLSKAQQIILNNPEQQNLPQAQNPRSGSSKLNLAVNPMALAQTIAPKLGVLTAMALFLSPAKAVFNAHKTQTIGDLNPIPIALMALSGVSWLTYGIATGDPYVILSNSPGCVIAITYLAGILPLLSAKPLQLLTTQRILIGGAAACFSLWTYLPLSSMPAAAAAKMLGLFSSTLTLLLFASPLSTMGKVFSTKDSSSILASLTFAQVFNTLLWTAYGKAIKDSIVWGPNAIGLVLGVSQLALKILFPASNPEQPAPAFQAGNSYAKPMPSYTN